MLAPRSADQVHLAHRPSLLGRRSVLAMPIVPVAIVSFGFSDALGREFQAWASLREWMVVDCTDLHRDPADVVRHDETGASPAVQAIVCGQAGFVEKVESIVAGVMTGRTRVAIGCTRGKHRSDVVSRFVEDILNLLPADSDGVVPGFAAKYWSITSCNNHRSAFERMLSDVVNWMEEPWQVPVVSGKKPHSERFGFAAAMQSRQSAMNWKDLHEWVDSAIATFREVNTSPAVVAPIAADGGDVPEASPAGAGDTVEDEHHEPSGVVPPSSSSSTVAPPPLPPRPQPPSTAPPPHLLQATVPPPPPPLPPIRTEAETRPLEEPPAATAMEEAPVPADDIAPISASIVETSRSNKMKRPLVSVAAQTEESSFAPNMPKWVSFERSPKQWACFLQDANVDERAAQDIFLLAQMSDEGWMAANSIIAKLVKKRSDGEIFKNVSGFIHTCVKNAREEMLASGVERRTKSYRESAAASSSSAADQGGWSAGWAASSSGWGAGWQWSSAE